MDRGRLGGEVPYSAPSRPDRQSTAAASDPFRMQPRRFPMYEEKRSSRRRDPIQRKRRRRLVRARPQLHGSVWSLPRAPRARGLFLSSPILTSPIERIQRFHQRPLSHYGLGIMDLLFKFGLSSYFMSPCKWGFLPIF